MYELSAFSFPPLVPTSGFKIELDTSYIMFVYIKVKNCGADSNPFFNYAYY